MLHCVLCPCVLEKAARSCTSLGWGGVVDGKTDGPQVDHISAHLGHKGQQLLPISEKGSRGHKTEAFLLARSSLKRLGGRKHSGVVAGMNFRLIFWLFSYLIYQRGKSSGNHWTEVIFPCETRSSPLLMFSFVKVSWVSLYCWKRTLNFKRLQTKTDNMWQHEASSFQVCVILHILKELFFFFLKETSLFCTGWLANLCLFGFCSTCGAPYRDADAMTAWDCAYWGNVAIKEV